MTKITPWLLNLTRVIKDLKLYQRSLLMILQNGRYHASAVCSIKSGAMSFTFN
jgi:hypothetical protein